jgi:hypothetical protein
MMAIRPSHRRIQERLVNLALSSEPVGYPTDPSQVDANFVARLQSLAIASSITPTRRSTRLRRQFGAVIGAVGILGWAGAAAAGASVGLAATGNLPAPVQDVVADVLDVVNISVPRPDPSPAPETPAPVSDSAPPLEEETTTSSTEGSSEVTEEAEEEMPATTVEISTTTTTAPDNSTETFAGEVIACSTPAAESNPNCFERLDDDTIAVVPVSPACDTPAATNNPNCQNDDEDDSNSSDNNGNGNNNTIPACDTPAATGISNCFKEVDEDVIIVVPSTPACNNPGQGQKPNCETTTTTTTPTTTNPACNNPGQGQKPNCETEDAVDSGNRNGNGNASNNKR